MATVTGLTADRMLAIEAASVVDGDVVGDNLILTKHDGTQINAGSVRGPKGDAGPVGQDLPVLSARSILDVGLLNQIRAGRQITATDFTNIGLSAPRGLWNLSDLTDSSGNGRNLLNKGAVPFTAGINGIATTAAQFPGSVAQALYIADTGASDPFRIPMGSIGCWFRTAKRGILQVPFAKWASSSGQHCWILQVSANNVFVTGASPDGTLAVTTSGVMDICDDRWHFGVATCDGTTLRGYIDGFLEASTPFAGNIFSGTAPMNVGNYAADGGVNGLGPFFGRVDEAFITADVLTEDQIRNLYCAKISHTLGVVPTRVNLNVRRRRKGAALLATDFPTPPLRLYNFSAGSLADEGSNNVVLANGGATYPSAGADGTSGNGMGYDATKSGGGNLMSTDAGLPAGTSARSYGCWFKSTKVATSQYFLSWGGVGLSEANGLRIGSTGILACESVPAGGNTDTNVGVYAIDGAWHFAVEVEDNAASDGVKRKLYMDGRLVGMSTVLNAITLAGANRFRIGARTDGSLAFTGQIDGVFVCDYALTVDQIVTLYAKSVQALALSPKNAGDHIEAVTATDILAAFDTLELQHAVDLAVA